MAQENQSGADEGGHFPAVLDREVSFFEGWPPKHRPTLPSALLGVPAKRGRLNALCLSGGGIRSATFCLGFLQGLAERRLLGRCHYLSTVSGGGYIGSWLSRWIRERGLAEVLEQLVPAKLVGGREPEPLRHLRAHSNYLSPMMGLSADLFTLLATFARNLLVHWLVLIPILAALVVMPRLYMALLALAAASPEVARGSIIGAGVLIVIGIAYMVADLPADQSQRVGEKDLFFLACFVPFMMASLLFGMAGYWLARDWHEISGMSSGAVGVGIAAVGLVVGQVYRRVRYGPRLFTVRALWLPAAVLVIGAIGGWVLWFCGNSWFARVELDSVFRRLYATLGVPFILMCFCAMLSLHAGLVRHFSTEEDREWWARCIAWWFMAALAWVAVFSIVNHLTPWMLGLAGTKLPGAVEIGVGGGALGVLVGLIGFWSKHGTTVKRGAARFVEATGTRLLDLVAIGVLLVFFAGLSYGMSNVMTKLDDELRSQVDRVVAQSVLLGAPVASAPSDLPSQGKALAYVHVLQHASVHWTGVVLVVLVGVSALWTYLVGVNTFSLHSMYCNRLVRAYLGAARPHATRNAHWFTGFDPDDNLPLAKTTPNESRRLLHVMCIALNQVQPSGGRLEWQQRKAMSFTASPLDCGSAEVGYVATSEYSGRQGGISLGRAMAISGAAASPNMGYHSSPAVTFVMTLLNLRLGWWLPNPGKAGKKFWTQGEPSWGAKQIIDEALGRTTQDKPWVYLSDGGHFENLGLYEMVRRRCRRIVVADASCDPNFEYEDLNNAIRKIRIDFGIPIEFVDELPHIPKQDEVPGRRTARAWIRYSEVDGRSAKDGILYYVKPVFLGNEPGDLNEYRLASSKPGSEFPHQSTVDQFFDESQFESYRMLGLLSARQAFPVSGRWRFFKSATPKKPSEKEAFVPLAYIGTTTPCISDSGRDRRRESSAGFGSMLESIGQGAVLASAVTVGGVLGVAGTLQLAPGAEISLAQKDRDLLGRIFGVSAPPSIEGSSSVTISGPTRDGALGPPWAAGPSAAQLQSLNLALGEATAALRAIAPAVDPTLAAQINDLSGKISGLTGRLPAPSGDRPSTPDPGPIVSAVNGLASATASGLATNRQALALVAERLDRIRASIDDKQLPAVDLRPIIDALGKINSKLEAIDATVTRESPRRSIRGVGP